MRASEASAGVRALLYAAALTTGAAFGTLFSGEAVSGEYGEYIVSAPGKGLFVMLGASLVALLVGSAGSYRFGLLLPSAALYALVVVYGFPPLAPGGWRELLAKIGADVREGALIMYAEPVPYDYQPGVVLLLIPAVVVLVAFATAATLYEESPVVSVAVLGLTIGVLSTVSFEGGLGPFFALFLILSVALLLSAGASAGAQPESAVVGGPGVVAGVVMVALVLALPQTPLAEQTIRPGAIDWTRIGVGETSRLQTQADVGSYLTSGRDAELLRIRSEEPLLWRASTMDYFDGVRWSETTEPGEDYGEEIAPGIEKRLVEQEVEVLDAETDLVFGGYRIISTSLISAEHEPDGSWSFPSELSEGGSYEVLSEIPQPTGEQLRSAGRDYPAAVEEKYLQLPGDRPEEIAETAQRIRSDYNPATPYDTALAVEEYFRYDGDFTYSLDADFRRANQALEDFLGEEREGFCTQFATAMALVLREQGIPARMVYGATTGQEVERDEYLVTGANMHTWVEVYFPGVGWYPFDPTPGFSMPQAMEANAPRQEISVAGPQQELLQIPRQVEQPVEESPERPDVDTPKNDGPTEEKQSPTWLPYVLILLLAAAAVPLTKRLLLARGRPEDLYRDLAGRLRDVLPPGRATLADSPALTPTERLLLLCAAAGVEERPFRELARAYSGYLYSAGPGPEDVRAVTQAYREALRSFEALPWWRRALGAVNPASLLARAGKGLDGAKTRLEKIFRRRFGKDAR